MQRLDATVEQFITRLQAQSALQELRVLRAWPQTRMPTRLPGPYAAVGLGGVQLADRAVGDCQKDGTVAVFCNLYVPPGTAAAKLDQLFAAVCRAVLDFRVTGVQAEPVVYDKTTHALVLKSVFTYQDAVDLGGDANV